MDIGGEDRKDLISDVGCVVLLIDRDNNLAITYLPPRHGRHRILRVVEVGIEKDH